MNKILICIFVILLSFGFSVGEAKDKRGNAINDNGLLSENNINNRLRNMENDIGIIRRDEINYKIEKDLLKDTFESNIKSINQVITLVLALFGILGFFGLKDISKMKTEYAMELDKLRRVTSDFEEKIKTILEEQKQVKEKYETIALRDTQQNNRIQVLECLEKIDNYTRDKNYIPALEWATAGLEIDKENILLLSKKSNILGCIGRFKEATEYSRKCIEIDPSAIGITMNLCEYYLLSSDMEEFDKLFDAKLPLFKKYRSDGVIEYLEVIRAYLSHDIINIKDKIRNYMSNGKERNEIRLQKWNLEEVTIFLKNEKDSVEKNIINNFISMIKGLIDINMMNELLEK